MQTRNIRLDSIKHQISTDFPDDITALLSEYRKADRWKSAANALTKELSALIEKYTNLKVGFHYNPSIHPENMEVSIPILNENHVLVPSDGRFTGDVSFALKQYGYKQIKGMVDLKEGKVYGDYTKIIFIVLLPTKFLLTKSSTKEITSKIMHEIGHIFAYLITLGRMTIINLTMMESTRQLMDCSSEKERAAIIFNAAETFNIPSSEVKTLSEKRMDEKGYHMIFMEMGIRDAENALGVNPYSRRGFEQLADAYVVRYGYGEHLAKFLKNYAPSKSLLYAAVVAEVGILAVILWPLLPFIMFVYVTGDYAESGDYDNFKDRLLRIKREITGSVKSGITDKARARKIVESFDKVEELVKKTHNRYDLYGAIAVLISSRVRKIKNLAEVQKELDELSNNPLYITSLRYKA